MKVRDAYLRVEIEQLQWAGLTDSPLQKKSVIMLLSLLSLLANISSLILNAHQREE